MSKHLERLLELDRLIRSPKRYTAIGFAEALDVSERTVRSDLDCLRNHYQAPLVNNRQKGYYYSDRAWRLENIPLTKGELFALTLGAKILQSSVGSAYAEELKSAIEQLSRRMPEKTWVNWQGLAQDQIMVREGGELNLNPEIWHKLETACQQKRTLHMIYYSAGRNEYSERDFDPYILHFSRSNPYVTGFCHLRQETRWFRIDRIQSLDILEETFEIDINFDAKKHFAMAFQHEVGGIPTQISIWFNPATAPFIRERRWHSTQQIDENSDGSLTLHFVAQGLNEVKRWILFYGKGAKAIAPPELVEMVREEVQQMNSIYTSYTEG